MAVDKTFVEDYDGFASDVSRAGYQSITRRLGNLACVVDDKLKAATVVRSTHTLATGAQPSSTFDRVMRFAASVDVGAF